MWERNERKISKVITASDKKTQLNVNVSKPRKQSETITILLKTNNSSEISKTNKLKALMVKLGFVIESV